MYNKGKVVCAHAIILSYVSINHDCSTCFIFRVAPNKLSVKVNKFSYKAFYTVCYQVKKEKKPHLKYLHYIKIKKPM